MRIILIWRGVYFLYTKPEPRPTPPAPTTSRERSNQLLVILFQRNDYVIFSFWKNFLFSNFQEALQPPLYVGCRIAGFLHKFFIFAFTWFTKVCSDTWRTRFLGKYRNERKRETETQKKPMNRELCRCGRLGSCNGALRRLCVVPKSVLVKQGRD